MWTIAGTLLLCWLLALLTSFTLGGWIHLLPLLSVLVILAGLLWGRGRSGSRGRFAIPSKSRSDAAK